MKALLPALVLLGAVLAGCAGSTSPTTTGPPPTPLEQEAAKVPPLAYDAAAGVDWWSDFAQTYTARNSYAPNNAAARDHIAAGLAAAGLQVRILQYPAAAEGHALPTAAPEKINVVEATKAGTGPGIIAFGAHYDNFEIPNTSPTGAPALPAGAPQAAYDNGAGTATLYNLCTAMARIPSQHTFVCLFFDGEELGTVGSRDYVADTTHPAAQLYLGFDMTGLNWPGINTTQPGFENWKLYAWTGPEFAETLFPTVNDTLHKVLGYPLSGAEAFAFNDRNSDEASFAQAHIPTIRFAGGRTASTYAQYHLPGDTVDYVLGFVGGRANFGKGMEAIVRTAYQLAMELDQTDLDGLKASH